MQKHCGFQEQIQFMETAGRRPSTGKVLDAAENVLNGSVGHGGSENDFVGILDAKANDVAVLQFAAIDLLSTHKDAAAVAPVFEIPQVALGDKRGTLTGDAAVRKLQMIPAFAASNTEGRYGEENKPPRAIGGYDFETRFVDGWKFRHRDHSVPGL
jgi:hypothetical protein